MVQVSHRLVNASFCKRHVARGTCFLARAKLANSYARKLDANAAAAFNPPNAPAPVLALSVADVLAGKARMLKANSNLKMPPVLENRTLVRNRVSSPHNIPLDPIHSI